MLLLSTALIHILTIQALRAMKQTMRVVLETAAHLDDVSAGLYMVAHAIRDMKSTIIDTIEQLEQLEDRVVHRDRLDREKIQRLLSLLLEISTRFEGPPLAMGEVSVWSGQ